MGRYKFGKADKIATTDGGYKVLVYLPHGGYTPMVDNDSGDAVIFKTREDAAKAATAYNEFSWDE